MQKIKAVLKHPVCWQGISTGAALLVCAKLGTDLVVNIAAAALGVVLHLN